MPTITPSEVVLYGNTLVYLARVEAADGSVIQAADVYSVHVDIFNRATGENLLNSGAGDDPAVADCIFDTLKTDYHWSIDSTGYNFRYVIGSSVTQVSGATCDIAVALVDAARDDNQVAFGATFSTTKKPGSV
jgi:hypothetical protein